MQHLHAGRPRGPCAEKAWGDAMCTGTEDRGLLGSTCLRGHRVPLDQHVFLLPPLILRLAWPEIRSTRIPRTTELRRVLGNMAPCSRICAAGTVWLLCWEVRHWSQDEVLCQQVLDTPSATLFWAGRHHLSVGKLMEATMRPPPHPQEVQPPRGDSAQVHWGRLVEDHGRPGSTSVGDLCGNQWADILPFL